MSTRAVRVAAPVVVALLVLLGWQALVDGRGIAPYLLPSPTAIWAQVRDNASDIVSVGRATGENALIGLVLGTLLGLGAALLAARLRLVDELLTPLSAAVNAMPIVALAPVFNTMFSSTSGVPRRLVVTIVVFFPVFVNSVRGLRQVDPLHAELMRSYAASGWAITRAVRLPGALPFVFTGVRIASSLAVIAAVVAEYFGGLQNGVGARITSAASNTAYARAWAYVLAACVLGLVFYLAALLAERWATPWRNERTAG